MYSWIIEIIEEQQQETRPEETRQDQRSQLITINHYRKLQFTIEFSL